MEIFMNESFANYPKKNWMNEWKRLKSSLPWREPDNFLETCKLHFFHTFQRNNCEYRLNRTTFYQFSQPSSKSL